MGLENAKDKYEQEFILVFALQKCGQMFIVINSDSYCLINVVFPG